MKYSVIACGAMEHNQRSIQGIYIARVNYYTKSLCQDLEGRLTRDCMAIYPVVSKATPCAAMCTSVFLDLIDLEYKDQDIPKPYRTEIECIVRDDGQVFFTRLPDLFHFEFGPKVVE